MNINKKIIISLGFSVFLLFTILHVFKNSSNDTVKVKVLDYSDIFVSNKYVGVVTPKETFPIVVEGPTIIEKFLVKTGDVIKKGDKLAIFSNISELENKKYLRNNEIDIEDTRLKLSNLESGPLKIELNNKILEIKNLEEEIMNKKRTLPILESEVKAASMKLKAYNTLFKEGGVTSTDLNNILSQSKRMSLDLTNLNSSIKLSEEKLNFLKESYSSLDNELSSEKKILLSKLEKLTLENDILKKRVEQLSTPLTSSHEGIVLSIDSKDGVILSSGQKILTIATPGKNKVKLEIPIEEAQNIKVGDESLVTPFNNEFGAISNVVGKVSKISSVAKRSNSNDSKDLILEAEIDMPDSIHFNPGYFVEVDISSNLKTNILSVDNFSVFQDNNQYFVFTLENEVAKKTPVDIGIKTKYNYEVLNLPKGTKIIINPFNMLDGQRVISE